MKSKKRRWILIVAVVLFLSGLVVLLYPTLTDFLYRNQVEQMKTEFISQFYENTSSDSQNQIERLYQELKRRNEELYQENQKDLKDPFSYQQPDIDLSEYGLPDNIIGFLKIDKIGIELPIYLGANDHNMSLGAVHLTQTSYPIGGENTNSVIAAHRGYSKTAMFRNIQVLEPGDQVTVMNFRETLTYEVVEIKVILPNEVDQLLIQPGRDMLTLITCHPYRHNSHRYVVYCQRV